MVYAVYKLLGSGPQNVPIAPVVPVTWTPNLNLPSYKFVFGPNWNRSLTEDSVKPVIGNGTEV